MRVLVIDDDKVFAKPLLWQLEQDGYKVTCCESVGDVLDKEGVLKVPRPDCILLDIMMPRGDRYGKRETDSGRDTGLKLLKDIQEKEPDIPVIVVTVRNDLSLHELQENYGDNIKAILVKPVTPTQVVDTLRRAL